MNVRPDPRFQNLIRNVQKPSLGKLSPMSQLGGNDPGGTITFDVELRGAGSAYTTAVLPKVDPLLKACGMTGSVSSGTSVNYTPLSTGIPGVTIYAYMDGVIWKCIGCRGNARLTMKVGDVAKWSFEMTARSIAFSDGAMVVGTYEPGNPQPPAWLKYGTVSAMKMGTGNYEAEIGSFEISLGNDVQIVPNANVASGIGEVIIAARDIQGSFDPALVLAATNPFFTQAKAATELALTAQVGTTAFNRVITTATRMVMMGASLQERNGIRAFSTPFRLSESATGDDEVGILYS
jgi:hypothetical protein